MGIRINTNTVSNSAITALEENRQAAAKSMIRLATGERITQAADDAAGLAISEGMKNQIRSQKQAERNSADAVSLVQVAEGALTEIGNNIIRMRELTVQAANDTFGDRERGFIDQEVQMLRDEINRVADTTAFNGVKLLNGQFQKERKNDDESNTLSIQIGVKNQPQDHFKVDINKYNVHTEAIGIDSDMNVRDIDSARDAMDMLDGAIDKINSFRADFGAIQNRLNSVSSGIATNIEIVSGANSRIRDTDYAVETAELVKQNIKTAAATALLAQANQLPAQALKLI